MHTPITFTIHDAAATVIAIASFVGAVTVIINVIVKSIRTLRVPEEQQNQKISSLEVRMKTVEDEIVTIQAHQKNAEEAWSLYMRALFDMLNCQIDGNTDSNLKDLRHTRDAMQDYITRHRLSDADK